MFEQLQTRFLLQKNWDSSYHPYTIQQPGEESHPGELHLAYESNETVVTHTGNPFIYSYKIQKSTYGFNYYRAFLSVAKKQNRKAEVEKVYFVDYFATTPLEDKMTKEQLSYLTYIRSSFYNGMKVRVTESYLRVFVSEILSLTEDGISKEEGMRDLLQIWNLYYGIYPVFDKDLLNTIQDFSFVFSCNIPKESFTIPKEQIQPSLLKVVFGHYQMLEKSDVSLLLLLVSDYDYHTSAFYLKNKDLCDQVLPDVLTKCVNHYLIEKPVRTYSHEKTTRLPFVGFVYAQPWKYVVHMDCVPDEEFVKEFSFLKGTIKYAENILRKYVGSYSHLTLPRTFSIEQEQYIQSLMQDYLQKKKIPTVSVEPRPEYEVLYDLPKEQIEFSKVEEIESTSWDNTFLLISEEEKESLLYGENEQTQEAPCIKENSALSQEAFLFLKALIEQKELQVSLSKQHQYANEINSYFEDESEIADIVLELRGNTYTLIDDYIEELQTWLAEQARI